MSHPPGTARGVDIPSLGVCRHRWTREAVRDRLHLLLNKEIFADINRFIDGTEYGSSMSVDISLIEWLTPVFGSQMLAASGSSPFGRPAPVLGPAPVSRVPGTGTCCCPPVAKGVRCPGGPALLLGQPPPTRVCRSGVLHPVLPASAGRRRQGLWEGACGGLLPWRCR